MRHRDDRDVSVTLSVVFLLQNTHELKVHQIVVRVSGWCEVKPVSMDRTGVYFREAMPEETQSDVSVVSHLRMFKGSS